LATGATLCVISRYYRIHEKFSQIGSNREAFSPVNTNVKKMPFRMSRLL
jgi:hypothetical protein